MKIKKTSVLIPDPCYNPLAYYVIRCLKEASSEFEVNLIVSSDKISNDNSWLVFYKHSLFVDNLFFAENPIDSVQFLDEVIRIVENKGIDIIYPASEEGYKFVAKYHQLSKFCKIVALPSDEALYTAFDKWKLYLFLKQHNISTPESFLLEEIKQVSQFNYPILLKPVDGSGGKNIQKFDSLTKENSQFIFDDSNEVYIVQEYIDGYDMGCSVICHEGKILAYTIQQQLGEAEGFGPKIDKLKFVHDSAVIEIVTKTMNALQWNGIANLDLRYNSQTGQICVIEINPRFWQSLMGSLSVGVNFPYLLYLLSSDISFEPVSYPEKYYAKFHQFIKDALNGSLQYSLSNTNFKYFLSDRNSLLQMIWHKIYANFLFRKEEKNGFSIIKVPSIP
ncbi:ATP-grasp domain-containing protein [Calothrix sp. CCY 0018]|uniref:ATP-grasp domain-containing protein n=1 Tax=Calothrix sp. CCY 0018 TaxID=3103864 RepID=UPI0039C69EB0